MNPLPFGGGGIRGGWMDNQKGYAAKEYFIVINGQRVLLTQFHRDEFNTACKGLVCALGIMLLGFGVSAAVLAAIY